MTCVSLIGLNEFNTQYFFMGMVRFESQEYTLQGRMQFFAKLDKIRLFSAWFVMTNVFTNVKTHHRAAVILKGIELSPPWRLPSNVKQMRFRPQYYYYYYYYSVTPPVLILK